MLERFQHAANSVVNHGDHARRQRHGLLNMAVFRHKRDLRRGWFQPLFKLLARVLQRRRRHGMGMVGRVDCEILGVVHIPVLAGGIEGMVRIGKRHKQEKRLLGIGLLQPG